MLHHASCCFSGQDVTILAYGQSESGKTYTLVGPELSCAMNEEDFGIVQRVFRFIFQSLQVNSCLLLAKMTNKLHLYNSAF